MVAADVRRQKNVPKIPPPHVGGYQAGARFKHALIVPGGAQKK